MAVADNGLRGKWADFLPVSAVLAAGLTLSVLVFMAVRGYYRTLDQHQFQHDVTYYGTSFKGDVERHVNSLAAIQAFVASSRSVTRWEFSAFAGQTLPRNPGFKAVLWVPRIPQSGRSAYEAQLQRDGLYGLRIRQIARNGALVAAGERPFYMPVGFVEPFDRNGSLVGLDLAADPVYARLFTAAEQGRRVSASPLVTQTLIAGARGPAVLIAFPLDASIILQRGTDAPSVPQGFALGMLELDRIITDAIDPRSAPLQAAIADAGKPGSEPAVFAAGAAPIPLNRWIGTDVFHQTLPFDIAGRRFFLVLRSEGHSDPLTRFYAPLGAALLVVALIALLAQNMLATTLRKRSVERAVIARTAELSAVNETLREEVIQRRQAEAGLRVARDKAESANHAKSAFLATMSHELRTPLNAIIGFSGILAGESEAFDARVMDYLHEIHDSGVRLLELINDILDLIQMDSQTAPASAEPIYLSDAIAAVVDKLQPQAQKAGVTLASMVPDGLPWLQGDGRRLQKALLHLAANAVKFTGRGGIARIAARVDPDGSLSIEVRDNGPGMPPEAQSRIRDLFSQCDSRLSRGHEGVGLGLSFVRRVADLHEAAFHIGSRPGEGTLVSLTFPPGRIARRAEVA